MNYFDLLIKEDKLALNLDNKSYTYKNLFDDSLNLSLKIKTSKKEIIAIYSNDIYFQLISFFAANRCENVPVIFHPNLSKESIDEIMKKNNINYLLTKEEEGIKFKKVNNFEGVIENKKICMGALTSGSTGIPKVLFRTYESWAKFFPIQNKVFNINSNSKMFFNGPLSFTGNLNSILGVIYERGTLISISGFNPRKWLKALKDFKVTNIYLVPAKLKALIQIMDTSLVFVKSIFTGSQQLFGDLSEELKNSFKNAEIIIYYGASELNYITYTNIDNLKEKPLSLGKAFKDVNVFIKDGYIYVDSKYHVEGMNNPCTVYDVGYIDKDGDLIFQGRNNDVINKGGIKISSLKVENEIKKIKEIKNAVIDTYEDENKGKELIAYVVLKDKISKGNIKLKLKEKLTSSEIPKKIIFLDEIPLNDSGKVNKTLLKEKANAYIM